MPAPANATYSVSALVQAHTAFLNLMEHAAIVITDSGGVQKEAYFFKTACARIFDWAKICEAFLYS